MTDTAIIDHILRREGGFVDHPADQGGSTNYGITQRTLKQYRGRPVTVGELRALEEGETRLIYERLYIRGPGFDRIRSRRLRALVIDCAVNHGPSRAARWLQAAVGTRVDGVFGPLTLAAANAAEEETLYKRVLAQRCRFYGQIIARDPSQAAFAAGWAARLAEFIEEAV